MYDYRFLQVIDSKISITEQTIVKRQLTNKPQPILESFLTRLKANDHILRLKNWKDNETLVAEHAYI